MMIKYTKFAIKLLHEIPSKPYWVIHSHILLHVNITVASQQDKENSDKKKKRQKSTISLNQLKYISYCIVLIS